MNQNGQNQSCDTIALKRRYGHLKNVFDMMDKSNEITDNQTCKSVYYTLLYVSLQVISLFLPHSI